MIATNTLKVFYKKEDNHRFLNREVDSLEDMQQLVGGLIECISLPHNIDLWVNEEGMIRGLEINLMLLWNDYHQAVSGPVFFAGKGQNGETISLSKEQRQWIAQHLLIAQLNNGNSVVAVDLRENF
ncbi:DUF3846 domain-containing protein [Bacillus infantis]|uniref:DUF3846 domain-containing protein n=1 Tax=Bacillus infantis TaxID=324767 RepID=A0A5D4SBR9_9BACI|nr:DUF3846 domain-containing protein [Bacillus infantis]TYS60720.1 DUF3846 domain-containing protein [Bacillus infantis]